MLQPAANAERRDAADAILDAAEAVFADHGFAAATTRAIADLAKVNLALIHYYFRTKEQLFEAVFVRRSDEINDRRRVILAELFSGDSEPALEQILVALLRPTIEVGRMSNGGGFHYARMVVNVASGHDERSTRLTGMQYNGIAREFIDAIQKVVPGISREMAVWSYMHAINIAMPLMARNHRAAVLSDGLCRDDDLDAVIDNAVTFIAAGIRALAISHAVDEAGRLRSGNNSTPA